MKNVYLKILIANMVSGTGQHKKWVRKNIESEYGFPYWKKLNTGTGSLAGRNEKWVQEDIESRYGFSIWFLVLEENKYG